MRQNQSDYGSLLYCTALDRVVHVAERVRDGEPAPPATSYADIQNITARYFTDLT